MDTLKTLVITRSGQELMARLIAGMTTATFTRVCTSDFDYSNVGPESIMQLQQIRQEAAVSEVKLVDGTVVEVSTTMSNEKLTKGYYVQAVGLYAEDSEKTEILYAVSVSERPDYIPASTGKTIFGMTFKMNAKLDNVNLEINPEALATVEQLKKLEELIKANGKVVVGTLETKIDNYDICMVVEEQPGTSTAVDFEIAGITNFAVGTTPPSKDVENFGKVKIVEGKLTVESQPKGDTIFFAKV